MKRKIHNQFCFFKHKPLSTLPTDFSSLQFTRIEVIGYNLDFKVFKIYQ